MIEEGYVTSLSGKRVPWPPTRFACMETNREQRPLPLH